MNQKQNDGFTQSKDKTAEVTLISVSGSNINNIPGNKHGNMNLKVHTVFHLTATTGCYSWDVQALMCEYMLHLYDTKLKIWVKTAKLGEEGNVHLSK